MEKGNGIGLLSKKLLLSMLVFLTAFTIVVPRSLEAAEAGITHTLDKKISDDQLSVQYDIKAFSQTENITIAAIGNPDGTITEGDTSSFRATYNGTFTFVINYKVKGGGNEITKQEEVEFEVSEIKANENVMESNAPAKNTRSSSRASFKDSFKISYVKDGLYFLADNRLEIGRHYNENFTSYNATDAVSSYLMYAGVQEDTEETRTCRTTKTCKPKPTFTGWSTKFAAVSTYEMDFTRNFVVEAKLNVAPTLRADGFTMGFQTDPNLVYTTGGGGSLGVYNYNGDWGARNGVIFEVDLNNNGTAWEDKGLGSRHLSILTTKVDGNTDPTLHLNVPSIGISGNDEIFSAKWVVTNATTGTGDLTFQYGSASLVYRNFRPHLKFGGSITKPTASYLTFSGSALKDFGSNNRSSFLELVKSSYAEDEVDARNAFIFESEAKALNAPAGLIPYNKATAFSKEGNVVTPNTAVTEWNDLKNGVNKKYDVTYSYGTASKTVNANVIPDGTPVAPEFALLASDATISVAEAKLITKKEDLILRNNAKVLFLDNTTTAPAVEAPMLASIMAGVPGKYYVNYSYGTGASYRETMVLLEVKQDKKHEVFAEDALITQSEAKALLTSADLIPYNKASVTTNQGVSATPNITVNDWAAIKAGIEGTYQVTYSYGTGAVKGEKTVTIKVGSDGDISPERDFILSAQDGLISSAEAKALPNMNALIPYNQAKVTLLNGTDIPAINIVPADWIAINTGVANTYSVLYSYGSGTNMVQMIRKIRVYEEGTPSPNKDFVLTANNTILSQSEAKILANVDSLKTYTSPNAAYANGTNQVPSANTTDFAQIKAGTVGTFYVTYEHGTGTNTTRRTVSIVIVKDGSIIASDRHVALYAEDATLTQEDGPKILTKEHLIPKSNAVVTLSNGLILNPEIAFSSNYLTAVQSGTPGKYGATFTYQGLSKNTTVTVSQEFEMRMIFDYDNNGRIDISDFADFIRFYTYGGANASPVEFMLSDYNGDGRINIDDLSEIRYYMTNPDKKPPMIKVPV